MEVVSYTLQNIWQLMKQYVLRLHILSVWKGSFMQIQNENIPNMYGKEVVVCAN